jgi:hypothetical protein
MPPAVGKEKAATAEVGMGQSGYVGHKDELNKDNTMNE